MGLIHVFRRLTAAFWRQMPFHQPTTNTKRARQFAKMRSHLIFPPSAYRPAAKLELPKSPPQKPRAFSDEGPDSLATRQFGPLRKSPEIPPLPPKVPLQTMRPAVELLANYNQGLLLRDPGMLALVESKLRMGQRINIARNVLGDEDKKSEVIQVWSAQGYFWTQRGGEFFRELDLRTLLKTLPQ